ncbi:hypothetical protein [Methylocella sp.]|uniref:hypothetical protein n=1 Tax=Methylocella sp. TaxID=1978226 RepID=UPI00378336F3
MPLLTSALAALTLFSGAGATAPAMVEPVQYYRDGQRQCWYPNDLDGPGWRPCGYNWRRDAGPRASPPTPAQRGQPYGTPQTWGGRQWGPGYGPVKPPAPPRGGPRPPRPPSVPAPVWRTPDPGPPGPISSRTPGAVNSRVDSRIDSRAR